MSIGWNPRRLDDFRASLLGWYDASGRQLPWRRDNDPYRVWVSEIMLQQTRVAAVIPYFERFMQRFPTVQHLARAREASVLATWSGLGYYRRARLMHAAARMVTRRLGGEFPTTVDGLLQLPGIGAYTAAAIASIAFGHIAATVDGNIERVIARISGRELTRTQVWQAAQELVSSHRPGDHNQAVMELGATICVPKAPRCSECPVVMFCATRGDRPRKPKEVRNKRQIAIGFARRNGSVYLVQRAVDASLMAAMWELPLLKSAPKREPLMRLRHAITSTDYSIAVHEVKSPRSTQGRWMEVRALKRLPLTGLTRKVMKRVALI